MKKLFNRISLVLLALIALAVLAGAIPVFTGLVYVVGIQAIAFAIAAPQLRLFIGVITEEQTREFTGTLKELGDVMSDIRSLIKEFPQFKGKLEQIQRQMLSRTGPATNRPKGSVSDDCARGLAAAFVLHVAKSGKFDDVVRNVSDRDALLTEARSIAGITRAMSTTEVPLPVVYGTELMELIAEFGVARQEMFGYPMSGGQNRPPRWGTRPQFGSITMSAAVDEKKPTLEFCDLTSKKLGGIVILPTEIDTQSLVPMGRWLAQYGAVEFARAEDTWAFLADGTATYESVSGICKIAADNSKSVVLASGKTKPSDATLESFRALRRKVNTAALAGGKYYLNQSWEGALRAYNTVNEKVFDYRPDGTATLDGFPIRWTEVMQPYQDTAAASANLAVFGRLKFWLFGPRGIPRIDTSEHAYFLYDQIATRFLEELDFDYLSLEAASVLKTAAS